MKKLALTLSALLLSTVSLSYASSSATNRLCPDGNNDCHCPATNQGKSFSMAIIQGQTGGKITCLYGSGPAISDSQHLYVKGTGNWHFGGIGFTCSTSAASCEFNQV